MAREMNPWRRDEAHVVPIPMKTKQYTTKNPMKLSIKVSINAKGGNGNGDTKSNAAKGRV